VLLVFGARSIRIGREPDTRPGSVGVLRYIQTFVLVGWTGCESRGVPHPARTGQKTRPRIPLRVPRPRSEPAGLVL